MTYEWFSTHTLKTLAPTSILSSDHTITIHCSLNFHFINSSTWATGKYQIIFWWSKGNDKYLLTLLYPFNITVFNCIYCPNRLWTWHENLMIEVCIIYPGKKIVHNRHRISFNLLLKRKKFWGENLVGHLHPSPSAGILMLQFFLLYMLKLPWNFLRQNTISSSGHKDITTNILYIETWPSSQWEWEGWEGIK